jgi:hypothetical protein
MPAPQANADGSAAGHVPGQILQFSSCGYDKCESYGESIENNIPHDNQFLQDILCSGRDEKLFWASVVQNATFQFKTDYFLEGQNWRE